MKSLRDEIQALRLGYRCKFSQGENLIIEINFSLAGVFLEKTFFQNLSNQGFWLVLLVQLTNDSALGVGAQCAWDDFIVVSGQAKKP